MFRVKSYNSCDKDIIIKGPDEFKMRVDHDDVNYEFVELMTEHIVRILNGALRSKDVDFIRLKAIELRKQKEDEEWI
jgi:hypothetical protein